MNLGDEAILEGILQALRLSVDADIVVFSFNPADTEKRHGVRAIAFREMHKEEIVKELEKLDLFILGGGGILFDGLGENLLRDVNWAEELSVPVFIYAISAGPINGDALKELIVSTLNKVDRITVRENESKRLLNEIGVTNEIVVTADPALLIEPITFTEEMLQKEGIDLSDNLVGISVREPGPAAPQLDNIEHYHSILANSADFIIDRFDARVVFIPMEPKADSQHAHAVISKMSNIKKASVLRDEYTSGQILGLTKHLSFAVGMRLHFLIFSGLQSVPFVPLAYASKVRGFLDDLDLEPVMIEEWSPGKICAMIDRAWDTRTKIKKNLEKKVPKLKEKAKETNQILLEFLKTITPKS